jgi:hypothetical protein
MATPVNIVKQRPAETAMPVVTAVALLIGKAIGVEDTDTIAYIAIVLSFIPAVVTWIVDLRKSKSDDGTTYEPSSST